MRLFFMLLGSFALAACQSYVVKDLDLIRPDYLTGYKTKDVFDDEKLKNILPQAQLKEESIHVTQESSSEIVIKGVGVALPETDTTVLYFGGNLTHVDQNAPHLSNIAVSCPINFYTFDYRGYGRTNGEPDVIVLKADALRIYDHVRAQTKGKLVVHGYSLGSFMAGYIAENRSVDGLVLEASSTNPDELIRALTPWYYKPFVTISLSDNLKTIDNLVAVSKYSGNALVITGEKDTSTPEHLGRKLFEGIPSQNKNYLMIPGGTHSRLSHSPLFKESYCSFMQKLAQS